MCKTFELVTWGSSPRSLDSRLTSRYVPLPAQDSHLRKSSCSARDCLGEPVETPESEPPLEVESRSLLQGTEADLRIVTVEPIEEEREREHKTFSETLKVTFC